MKKFFGAASAALAAVFVLSAPVYAAQIITGDSFTSEKKAAEWVTDRYEPEEFDIADGQLYLALGKKGTYSGRAADKKEKRYAIQGRKLPTAKPTTNTWTATVKIELDDPWFSSGEGKKRAEFRVDLVDGEGNAVATTPSIAVIKGGGGFPNINIASSKSTSGWSTIKTYIDGDKEIAALDLEMGWHTLSINCNKGLITYYLDEKKLGSCPVTQKDLYPAFMALTAQNFERPDVICWDNCYLYDGSVLPRQRSSEAQDKYEDNMEEKYEKKRNNWEDKYTLYRFKTSDNKPAEASYEGTVKGAESKASFENGKWYSQRSMKNMMGINEKDWSDENKILRAAISSMEKNSIDFDSRESKDMPDSYWDY